MSLPIDSNGRSIQVLAPGTSIVLSPNAASASGVIPTDAKILYIAASGDVWLKFGVGAPTAAAAADNLYLPGGVVFLSIPSITGVLATHIAAFSADAQTVCVSALK